MNSGCLFWLVGALSLGFFLASCRDSKNEDLPETLFHGEYDESAMDRAMADARKSLGHFKEVFAAGRGEGHAVKVAVHDGEDTEHFWLVDIEPSGEGFRGVLGNEPGIVSNVKEGDVLEAQGKDLSDWMYLENNKMHGNYTLRILMPGMAPEEAQVYEQMLAPLAK